MSEYKEGYHNEFPTIIRSDGEPIDNAVIELNRLHEQIATKDRDYHVMYKLNQGLEAEIAALKANTVPKQKLKESLIVAGLLGRSQLERFADLCNTIEELQKELHEEVISNIEDASTNGMLAAQIAELKAKSIKDKKTIEGQALYCNQKRGHVEILEKQLANSVPKSEIEEFLNVSWEKFTATVKGLLKDKP